MNKILDNLYIFSKLTTILVLLSIIIFMSYVFIKSYSSQNIGSNALDERLNSVFNSIDNNSQNLIILKNKAISNEKAFNEFKNSFNEDKFIITKNNIEILVQENKKLNEKIAELSNELSKIKKSTTNNNSSNQNLKNSFDDLFNIIILKYENGHDVKEEILTLQKINTNINYESTFEKLLLISENNFVGLENFEKIFQNCTKDYLNNYFVKKNNYSIIRFLSNFINIEPNFQSDYTNENIKQLVQARNNIKEKNIELSLSKITKLPSFKNYFKTWIDQAQIYIEFNQTLNQIKKQNV